MRLRIAKRDLQVEGMLRRIPALRTITNMTKSNCILHLPRMRNEGTKDKLRKLQKIQIIVELQKSCGSEVFFRTPGVPQVARKNAGGKQGVGWPPPPPGGGGPSTWFSGSPLEWVHSPDGSCWLGKKNMRAGWIPSWGRVTSGLRKM